MQKISVVSHPTVCIIGAGFAGLGAAVFLDNLGLKVTVLEKKPILGGRTYAFREKKTETWVDNGQHLLMGAYHDTIRLVNHIGASRHLFFQEQTDVPLITDRGELTHFRLPSIPAPFNFLFGLARLKPFSWRDKWKTILLGKKLRALKNNLDSPELNKSVTDWLTSMGQSSRAQKNFWDILTLATLNDDPAVASARMLAVVLTKGLLGPAADTKLIVPRDNLNELLAKPAQAYLEMRGHTMRTEASVRKIHILDRRVQAVELTDGEMIKADYVISAVPFRNLLNMIPEGFIDAYPYFSGIRNLKTAPIVSINLWFDQDVMPDCPFVGVADAKVHWYFNKNKLHDITHPPYHVMGVVSGAYQLMDLSREEILQITLEEMGRFFPRSKKAGLIHALVNKEREATLSPTVESEAFRPNQQSPFENFYVIGDWTKTGYPATIESAVRSAKLAVEDLEKRIQKN